MAGAEVGVRLGEEVQHRVPQQDDHHYADQHRQTGADDAHPQLGQGLDERHLAFGIRRWLLAATQ